MDRRAFVEAGGYAALAAGLGQAACAPANAAGRLDRIGAQLYTVRREMAESVEATLDQVAEIGYREVEFAGYFGRSPEQIRDALGASGLDAPSTHVPLGSLGDGWERQLDAALVMGHRYVVVAWIAAEQRHRIDDYRRYADQFNRAGERARERGLRFAYHNHEFEFEPLDGEVPYDVLLARTDAALVEFELDLFWITKGGHDPIAYFGEHPGRFPLVHVKDMNAGGDMTPVGTGVIDFPNIFMHRDEAGIRHFFVEHDNPGDPFASLAAGFEHLRGPRF